MAAAHTPINNPAAAFRIIGIGNIGGHAARRNYHKDGRLVGGLGVSGDGVEQDHYVSQLGSEGFHPPDELRVDNSVIIDADGREARVPYVKFPRHPEFETVR